MKDILDLPVIRVKRVLSLKEAEDMNGVTVPELEANVTEAGIYVDEDTDEPFLVYMPMEEETTALRQAVLKVKYGTLTRTNGMEGQSRNFGMMPRKVMNRRESCRPTSLSYEEPEAHAVLVSYADRFAEMLQQWNPTQYAHDEEVMEQVSDDWMMSEHSLWTSGVINKSATLPFHFDKFNFETWSAMPVVRRQMRGGYLHFPEYNATCACRDGWVLFFPGWKFLHGVTPMKPLADDAYRYSVVYYALKGMKDCFTYAVEQAKGNANRTEREEKMAAALKGEMPIADWARK